MANNYNNWSVLCNGCEIAYRQLVASPAIVRNLEKGVPRCLNAYQNDPSMDYFCQVSDGLIQKWNSSHKKISLEYQVTLSRFHPQIRLCVYTDACDLLWSRIVTHTQP